MIPQVSVEIITEVAKKLADMAEQVYKVNSFNIFENDLKEIQKKQPYLLSWFAIYCQACIQQGMPAQDIAAMQVAFIAVLKALYTQDEVSELDKMFGENSDEGDTKRKS